MSSLPKIDQNKVINKLTGQLAEALLQVSTIETLAEQLRDERDALQKQLDSYAETDNSAITSDSNDA